MNRQDSFSLLTGRPESNAPSSATISKRPEAVTSARSSFGTNRRSGCDLRDLATIPSVLPAHRHRDVGDLSDGVERVVVAPPDRVHRRAIPLHHPVAVGRSPDAEGIPRMPHLEDVDPSRNQRIGHTSEVSEHGVVV